MIFATADSSKLIKNGDATKYDQHNQIIENNMNTSIIESVFGKKLHEEYNSLKKYHGIASKGFHITSCQFAIHYFFKNKETDLSTLNSFCSLFNYDCTIQDNSGSLPFSN